MQILEKIRLWFASHLIIPLREMTWTERLLLISFGLWFGVFPVPGLSTTLLLLSFLLVNRYSDHRITVSESTVATAINILSTPLCIALLPFWMYIGTLLFKPETRCKASVIIDMLYVTCFCFGESLVTTMAFGSPHLSSLDVLGLPLVHGSSPLPSYCLRF